jgi:hypothetical protein
MENCNLFDNLKKYNWLAIILIICYIIYKYQKHCDKKKLN